MSNQFENNVPTAKFTSATCFMCEEYYKRDVNSAMTLVPCGHIACKPCIESWRKQNNTCPQCRKAIQKVIINRGLMDLIEDIEHSDTSSNNINRKRTLIEKERKEEEIIINHDDMTENQKVNIDDHEDVGINDENILLNTNNNNNRKRTFDEIILNSESKEEEIIINQPKIKKRRINNEEIMTDFQTMTDEQAQNLEKGDFIDHQYRNGKYMEAKIINKRGSDLRIKYLDIDDTIWSDYAEKELAKFAKYKYISTRPAHRLNHLQIGDTVYLNLKISFENKKKYKKLGWIKCIVKEKDNGQIKVEFIWEDEEESYWVHLDNKDVISDDNEWVQKQMKRYIPVSIRLQIAGDEQNWECACCKKQLLGTFEIDHIKPVHDGGTNDRKNLQVLHPECHRIKAFNLDTITII